MEHTLLHYVVCSDPLTDIYGRLGGMCLRWDTEDEMDQTKGREG